MRNEVYALYYHLLIDMKFKLSFMKNYVNFYSSAINKRVAETLHPPDFPDTDSCDEDGDDIPNEQ